MRGCGVGRQEMFQRSSEIDDHLNHDVPVESLYKAQASSGSVCGLRSLCGAQKRPQQHQRRGL
jgi:hypothetical protein